MLSYQLKNYYKYIKEQIEDFDTTLKLIYTFSEKYNLQLENISTSILSTHSVSTTNGITHYGLKDNPNILTNFNNLINDFKSSFDFLSVVTKFNELRNHILTYKNNNSITDTFIDMLLINIDSTIKVYQQYYQNPINSNAVLFAKKASELVVSITSFKAYYNNYLSLISNNVDYNDENDKKETFEIQLLQTDLTVEKFANSLSNINNIYNELGSIIYKESTEVFYCDLSIIKIESGSLLADVLGDKNIISCLGLLFNKTIELIFNKFTREGKLYRHKELMTALREESELGANLKVLGYDISDNSEHVEKTYALITKDLLHIASSSSNIKIDKNEYKINDFASQQKYIEDNRALLIENKNE